MRNRSKLLLAALTAAVTLGALVSSSTANRLALSSQGYKATWPSFELVGGPFGTVRCPVTMEGSFHSRTLSKVSEQLVGYVSGVTVGTTSCTGGRARALLEALPWHVRYETFIGTLPEITAIELKIKFVTLIVESANLFCLYTASATSPMKVIVNRNTTTHAATSMRINEAAGIPKSSGGGLCPNPEILRGTTNSLTQQGSTNEINIILTF
jgi:hypothetical protein